MGTTRFYDTCRALFSERLGHGRRWKSAAAQALGIGRATLYRYFESDTAVGPEIWARLNILGAGRKHLSSDRDLVTLFARGLVDLQDQVDEHGWLKGGYPAILQRAFDLAAARNAEASTTRWPTDLAQLTQLAERPLFEWVGDLTWDPEGDFTAAVLIAEGEVTPVCIELAMPGRDPELELTEQRGYALLRSICLARTDGQEVYTAFRRLVVERPVLDGWTSTFLTDPLLASVERIDEIVTAFYQRVPEALAHGGDLPICAVSGIVVRRQGHGFHTECRNPEAVRRARAGHIDRIKWRPGVMHLRRPFRLYWCLPGKSETGLARQLEDAGWTCTMWPRLDRIDLAARSPNGDRRIAVDVKDHLSPESLAARFEGFKTYAADHECFLVVPDYMPEIAPGYERRFEAVRAAHGKAPVALRTVSQCLADLGIAG